MKGVVIAAGSGTRLSPYHQDRHKVLLTVGGRAIIDYTLEAFCEAGITDVAIVIGYRGDAIRDWVGDGSSQGLQIRYVHNPDYRLGNALSLQAASSFTEDSPFFLSMADHMISPALLAQLVAIQDQGNVLAVDFGISPRDAGDGTRVLVNEDGLITDIGKDIPLWNGIDAGVFRLTPAIFEAIADVVAEEQSEYQISQAISRMIERGHFLLASDISGCFWHDIDTWEDLNLARKALAAEVPWT